jgi:universal stress protein E
MFETILAAVADPQAPVQVAATKAAELAWLAGGRLVLYHAAYDAALSGRPFFDSDHLARARREHLLRQCRALDELARSLAGEGPSPATVAEWHRVPHEAIVSAAMREHAELVVAEPRFRAARRRLSGFSATDWELVKLCPVPLLLARGPAPYRSPTILAAVDPVRDTEKLSTLDLRIVQVAHGIERLTDGKLRMLHCAIEPRTTPGLPYSVIERERAQTRQLLKLLVKEGGLSSRALRVKSGRPAEAIAAAVAEESVDVLVLGSMTRGRFENLVLGSTAEKLLHTVACDMLVVKPLGYRTAVAVSSRSPREMVRGPAPAPARTAIRRPGRR